MSRQILFKVYLSVLGTIILAPFQNCLHLTFQEPSRTDTTQCLNTLQKGARQEDSVSLFKNSVHTEDGELFRDRVKSTDDATMAALTGLTAEVACVQIGLYKGRRRYHWRIRPPTKAFSTHKHMALSPTILVAKTTIRSNCNSCSRVSSTADLQPLAVFVITHPHPTNYNQSF